MKIPDYIGNIHLGDKVEYEVGPDLDTPRWNYLFLGVGWNTIDTGITDTWRVGEVVGLRSDTDLGVGIISVWISFEIGEWNFPFEFLEDGRLRLVNKNVNVQDTNKCKCDIISLMNLGCKCGGK